MGQKQSAPTTPQLPAAASKSENDSHNIAPSSAMGPSATSATNAVAIATQIESRANPSPQDAASHNYGQPLRSATTSSPSGHDEKSASQHVTDCRKQQRASLACIEENYLNKNEACADFFAAYKMCRKEEHERKLEANARASGWYD
mmetsp:Transcript_24105/g.51112  ORF Transcript_24105/g.51112 Transcript_24105/m.51112 type:complete len:146 (+) Transcript_24105:124-561(+)